jgi:hypothetical protein
VRRRIKSGKLKAIKDGRWLIPRSALEATGE